MQSASTTKRHNRPYRTARLFPALVLGLAFIFMLPVPTANACSCTISPFWGFYGAANSRLPANAAGVAWYAMGRIPGGVQNLVLTGEEKVNSKFRKLAVKRVPVKGFANVYLIAPKKGALKPGATYRFTIETAHTGGGIVRQVVVTVDRKKLTSKDALLLVTSPMSTKKMKVAAGVSCSNSIRAAQVSLEAKLPEHARAWRDQLLYRTWTDGKFMWSASASLCHRHVVGRSWRQVGRDQVYAACQVRPHGNRGLKQGKRTISMEAVLPGTRIVLKTKPKTVDLSCN
jgi:hypothetical protein